MNLKNELCNIQKHFPITKRYYYNNYSRQEMTGNDGILENTTGLLPIFPIVICLAVLVAIVAAASLFTYIIYRRRKGKLKLDQHLIKIQCDGLCFQTYYIFLFCIKIFSYLTLSMFSYNDGPHKYVEAKLESICLSVRPSVRLSVNTFLTRLLKLLLTYI